MITIYEQLKRAKKGEVLYTFRPARNVTSAASRLNRKVRTEKCVVATYGDLSVIEHICRVSVLK